MDGTEGVTWVQTQYAEAEQRILVYLQPWNLGIPPPPSHQFMYSSSGMFCILLCCYSTKLLVHRTPFLKQLKRKEPEQETAEIETSSGTAERQYDM